MIGCIVDNLQSFGHAVPDLRLSFFGANQRGFSRIDQCHLHFINDPLDKTVRKEMGISGRKKMEAEFDKTKIVKETVEAILK